MKLKKGQMQNFRDYADVLYLSDPAAVHYTDFTISFCLGHVLEF